MQQFPSSARPRWSHSCQAISIEDMMDISQLTGRTTSHTYPPTGHNNCRTQINRQTRSGQFVQWKMVKVSNGTRYDIAHLRSYLKSVEAWQGMFCLQITVLTYWQTRFSVIQKPLWATVTYGLVSTNLIPLIIQFNNICIVQELYHVTWGNWKRVWKQQWLDCDAT